MCWQQAILLIEWMVDYEYEEGIAAFAKLNKVLELYPDIAIDTSYIYVLESLAQHAHSNGDIDTMRTVQERTMALLDHPDLHELSRQAAIRRILPSLMKFFETPEELRMREESIPLIEQFHPETDPYYGTAKIQLLGLTGRLSQALELSDLVIRQAKDRGLMMNFFLCHNWRIIGEVGTGGSSISRMVDETRLILDSEESTENNPQYAFNAAGSLLIAGFLTGNVKESIEGIKLLGVEITDFTPGFQFMLDILLNRNPELKDMHIPAQLNRVYFRKSVLRAWMHIATLKDSSEASALDNIVEAVTDILRSPILQIYDLLTGQGTMNLWKRTTTMPLPVSLKALFCERSLRGLEWLIERELYACMEPLCLHLEELGETDKAKEWRSKIVESVPAPHIPVELEEPQEIQISMLGTIRVAMPSESFAPIRGVRIRTLLGLMVADHMIPTKLNPNEFLAIAGGAESDPEHARKKKNMAVVRLREIIGHDAIITSGPTPQLNLDLLQVDLLQLDSLVHRAQTALRQDAFVRALPLIHEALDIFNGEVPFPTLYEDFFEAVRGDFEYRLRNTIIGIGKGMLNMGDATGAEPLLRRALTALPGDEEIAELLGTVFEHTGNRIEAERIRMKMQT